MGSCILSVEFRREIWGGDEKLGDHGHIVGIYSYGTS